MERKASENNMVSMASAFTESILNIEVLEDDLKDKKDNSYLKGVALINISVLCMALQSMFSKEILDRNERLTAIEFYAMREFLSFGLWILFINVKLKHYLYDTVTRSDVKSLSLRSCFALGNTYFNI